MHLQEKLEMAVRKNEDHKRLFAALKRYQSDDYQVLADWYEERGFVNRAARQRLIASRIDYLRNVLFPNMRIRTSVLYRGHSEFKDVNPGIRIIMTDAAIIGYPSDWELRWTNKHNYEHFYYSNNGRRIDIRVPRWSQKYTHWIKKCLGAWDSLATEGETREMREEWWMIWKSLAPHEHHQLFVWGYQYTKRHVIRPNVYQQLSRRDCLALTEVVRQMRDEGRTIDMVELP